MEAVTMDLDRAMIVLLLFVIVLLGVVLYQLNHLHKTIDRWDEAPPTQEPDLPELKEADTVEAPRLTDETVGTFKGPTPWT